MTFAHPLWLLLLPLWLLVPVLDRMARPKAGAALPLPQLKERGLRALTGTLPWLSVHGLVLLLVVFALAGPEIPTRGGWLRQPALYLVAASDPASTRAGGQRYRELIERLTDHPIGVVTSTAAGPVLTAPLTRAQTVLAELWPPPAPARLTERQVAHSLLTASAKAPKGAWLIVIGGRSGETWAPALALAASRQQHVAHLTAGTADTRLPLAYQARLSDTDAISGLRFALEAVSQDVPQPGPPLALGRYCLGGALAILVLGWHWRQRRWQTVAP